MSLNPNTIKTFQSSFFSVRHKAMYLSEIARMNCEYDETETAVKFYRLAADTSIAKPNSNEKDCEEVTEQTQILLASVHDSG